MALVIFDLDETLIAADSCSKFCEFIVAEGLVDPSFVERDLEMMVQYMAGELDMVEYINFFIGEIRHLSIEEISTRLPRFIDGFIRPVIYPQAQQLITELKARGDRPLIISATSTFIVAAIADLLDVQDFLAIDLKTEGGYYTGEIAGIPSFREGKVTRLKQWLEAEQVSMDGAYFYTDSINDLPLLEQVDHPVATNPDEQLLQIAEHRHWPVLLWDKPNSSMAGIGTHADSNTRNNENNSSPFNDQFKTNAEQTHV